MDQARALGVDRSVLQTVVAEAALDENARRMGLGQSDAETMRMIYSDPNFKGMSGTFDAARFQATIRQFGYSEQRYIADQRKVSLRRQIAGTVTAGLEPSKTLIDALSRFQNEQRTIEYIKLDAAQVGAIDPPSPETLLGYFDEHKTQFRAPEYRKLSFVVINPEEVGKWTERIRRRRQKSLRGTPRQTRNPRTPPGVADDLSERRGGGCRSRTHCGRDVIRRSGERARPQSGRRRSGLHHEIRDHRSCNRRCGVHAANGRREPAGTRPFRRCPGQGRPDRGRGFNPTYESVAANLKREIAVERARASVADLHNKMEDERGGGASVVEAAQKLGLTAVTIDAVDRSGRAPNGQPVATIPQGLNVVSQAFASDVGVDNDPIQFNGGYVWFDVLGITPSRERGIDEVKDQVEARWRENQITSQLRTKSAEMVQKLGQDGKLADEAAALGLKVETAAAVKRDGSVPGLPGSAIEAAFRTAKGAAGQAQGATSSEWIVFRVTDVNVPPVDMASEETKKLKETLQRGLSDEQVAQYVSKLETDIGTTINEAAVAQVTGAANN